ncbi:MAG: hypothetical protein N4A63_16735 [Vallitalea sp.]|nr:hypothetical protein [Vallitalea sp.]
MPIIVIFLALLNAVIAVILAQIKMNLGFDVFSFYLFVFPIGSYLYGSIISKFFYNLLLKKEIPITKIYYFTTLFFIILSYFGMQYYIYYNTYVDYSMTINYIGDGIHISELYDKTTGNYINFFDYYFRLSSGGEMYGMIGGNGFATEINPLYNLILEIFNVLALGISVTFTYKKKKPPFKYCEKCNHYMNEKQVFIFDLGDNYSKYILEKIDESMGKEDRVDRLREIINVNQELRDSSNEFVVGNFNYCNECDQLYLVIIKYIIDERGNEKMGKIIKEYELDKSYFRLIIR